MFHGLWQSALGLALVLSSGCGPPEVSTDPFAAPQSKSNGETVNLWDVVYMQGSKVGYQHTQITPVTVDGKKAFVGRVDSGRLTALLRDE